MGILTRLLALPVAAPMLGTLWVSRQIAEAADAQHNDPGMLRTALIDAENRLLAGELSEDEYDIIETDLLLRLQAVQ